MRLPGGESWWPLCSVTTESTIQTVSWCTFLLDYLLKGGGAQQENETSTKGGRTVNFPGHVRRWLVGETDRPAIGNSSSLTSFPLPVVRMKSSSYSSSTWHGVLTGQVEILEIHRLHSVEQAVTSRHA